MIEAYQNRTFSILKAIGIFTIVIAHTAIYTQLYIFVYLFNVSVFFFVSGYFFNDDHLQQPIVFFKKKILRLYVPWVIYGIIFVLLHNLFLKLHLISYNLTSKTLIEPYSSGDIAEKVLQVLLFYKWKELLLAPLWFLFGLFSGLSVFYIVSFLSQKIDKSRFELYRFAFIVLLMIIGFIGQDIYGRFFLFYRAFIIAGLIYLGKLYSIYEGKIKLSIPIALLFFLGLCIATYFNYYINVGGMIFGNPIIFILITCAGCYVMLTVAYFINSKTIFIAKIFNYIGKNTLSIMALHYISLKFVSLIQIAIYDYPIRYLAYYPVIPYKTIYWWFPYTIVGIIVPIFLSFLYDKIKEFIIVNKFFKQR